MAARIHRPLRVIAFNGNGIWRRRYDLGKQLQDLRVHIEVALLSETHLKFRERFFIPNYQFCRTDCFPGRKGIPHNYVYLRYKCDTYTWQRRSLFVRHTHILSSEKMLHTDYNRNGSVAKKKISGREPQGAWCQDELIGGKPPFVKLLWLWLWRRLSRVRRQAVLGQH
jgi:hypothetical protein